MQAIWQSRSSRPKYNAIAIYGSGRIYLLLLFAFHAHFSKASRTVSRFTLCDVPSCCEREIYLKGEEANPESQFSILMTCFSSRKRSQVSYKREGSDFSTPCPLEPGLS